jgi:subtilisin family serine protease
MSLGGPHDQALNEGCAAVVEAGIFVVVSAGNEATRAEDASPASEPSLFTVGATDSNDAIATFSNFGGVVDIFAGGVKITSAWTGSNNATVSLLHTYLDGLMLILRRKPSLVPPWLLHRSLVSLPTFSAVTVL